jgi:hypothetical protein
MAVELTSRRTDRQRQIKARFAVRQLKRRGNLTDEQKATLDRALASDDVMESLADYIESYEETVKAEPAVGGPIADAFALLIQDFINNPEKWIKIIMMLFAL